MDMTPQVPLPDCTRQYPCSVHVRLILARYETFGSPAWV
jgi:hypothetical protein